MTDIKDISNQPGFNPNQHCTFPNQDGEHDYSFSHTAQYCGKPQPRRCPCAFDYSDGGSVFEDIATQIIEYGPYMTVPSDNDLYSTETVRRMLVDAAERGFEIA